METHVYDLSIRALVYPDEDGFTARALEMDLLGFGKTEGDAIEDLKNAVEAQISFAQQIHDASLLGFPAEKEYFERWENAQAQALNCRIAGGKAQRDTPMKLRCKAIFLSFSESQLQALKSRRFERKAMVCA
jgi:hypothetical protein